MDVVPGKKNIYICWISNEATISLIFYAKIIKFKTNLQILFPNKFKTTPIWKA